MERPDPTTNPTPPHRLAAEQHPGPSRTGCMVILTLIGLGLLLLLLRGEAPSRGPADDLPATTVFMLHLTELPRLQEALATSGLLNDQTGIAPLAAALRTHAETTLGTSAGDALTAAWPTTEALTLAYCEDLAEGATVPTPTPALILEQPDPAIAGRLVAEHALRFPTPEGETVSPDRSGLYVFQHEHRLILTRSPALRLALTRRPERSLAESLPELRAERRSFLTGDRPMATLLGDPRRLAELLPPLPATNLSPTARCLTRISLSHDGVLLSETRLLALAPPPPPAWGWPFTILIAILTVLLGIPALLITAVILLAASYWVRQRLSGRRTSEPLTAPAEISPALREDLGRSPLDFHEQRGKRKLEEEEKQEE